MRRDLLSTLIVAVIIGFGLSLLAYARWLDPPSGGYTAARMPDTAVQTDQGNVYSGSATQDFSAVTIVVATPTVNPQAASKGYVDATAAAPAILGQSVTNQVASQTNNVTITWAVTSQVHELIISGPPTSAVIAVMFDFSALDYTNNLGDIVLRYDNTNGVPTTFSGVDWYNDDGTMTNSYTVPLVGIDDIIVRAAFAGRVFTYIGGR